MKLHRFVGLILIMVLCLTGCSQEEIAEVKEAVDMVQDVVKEVDKVQSEFSEIGDAIQSQLQDSVANYNGTAYEERNNNQPEFTKKEKKNKKSFEKYSKLDSLGRCQVAFANVSKDTMPKKKRGNISMIKPSGWQSVRYDNVEGKSLYNRCHLIAHQLTGEDANRKNLITGTRYMNTEGMLPFENQIADYVKDTGNHVLYRVTPVYEGDNLVASGVQMEAYSVEDKGKGVCFNVYAYNVQPGIAIDYATGKSQKE